MQKKDYYNQSLIKLVAILIVIFSATTLFQTVFDKFSINRVVGGALLLVLFALLTIKISRKTFFELSILIVIGVFSVIASNNTTREITSWIYYLSTIFCLTLLLDDERIKLLRQVFLKGARVIKFVVYLECLFLVAFLFFGVGYQLRWQGSYFQGMCNNPHTLAALCCLILSLLVFYSIENRKFLVVNSIFAIIPIYALLQTGARTFLIPLMAIIDLYLNKVVKKRMYKVIIVLIAIPLVVWLFANNLMFEKFTTMAQHGIVAHSSLDNITSGRTIFWKEDINSYLEGNIIQIIFGKTFNNVYEVNLLTVGTDIWAHNDFIFILNGAGLFGLFIYLAELFRLSKKVIRTNKKKRDMLFLIIYVFIPAFINGFLNYPHFVYSFIILYLLLKKDEVDETIIEPTERQIKWTVQKM